jgi:hypothetical protein
MARSSTFGGVAALTSDTYLLPALTVCYLLMSFTIVRFLNCNIESKQVLQVKVGNTRRQSGRGQCPVYLLYPLYRGGLEKKLVVGQGKKEWVGK